VIEIIINEKSNLDVFIFMQEPKFYTYFVICFQLFLFSQVFVVVAGC